MPQTSPMKWNYIFSMMCISMLMLTSKLKSMKSMKKDFKNKLINKMILWKW